ncbi:hypothetical protein PRZ48_012028 [Zasmidium cellare]|uniref:Xylanolytic transcriptional activator regulatory domain-containing protein n=1 Tax=Zasmidium cellare TaxID=395010 RepID=A0ABR0E818_ZASCE|nr:hypothetical protein PRZ48_012028 [Zasmidium cellare]
MARFQGAAIVPASDVLDQRPRIPVVRAVSTDKTANQSSATSSIQLQTLQLWRCFDLPSRSVHQGLVQSFLQRCYPWAPVVDKRDLEYQDGSPVSFLLIQAVFLAASRVSSAPSVASFATSEHFYERAKTLFYWSYEEDPLKIIAATILLQWMNPGGPEDVSLDSSSYWLAIGAGLARQISLQIEPSSNAEGSLRRRLWWALVSKEQGCVMLATYEFSARQLHLPYLVTLLVKARSVSRTCQISSSPTAVLTSSFVAGIFEDFLARNEIQFLGPIVGFYLLAAGVTLAGLLSHQPLHLYVQQDLDIVLRSLQELAKRWPSAMGVTRAIQHVSAATGGNGKQNSTLVWLDEDEERLFEGLHPPLCRLWEPYQSQCAKLPTSNQQDQDFEPMAPVQSPEQITSRSADFVGAADHYPSESFGYNGVGDWFLRDWSGDLNWA